MRGFFAACCDGNFRTLGSASLGSAPIGSCVAGASLFADGCGGGGFLAKVDRGVKSCCRSSRCRV